MKGGTWTRTHCKLSLEPCSVTERDCRTAIINIPFLDALQNSDQSNEVYILDPKALILLTLTGDIRCFYELH
jgi:hypothetical protein